MLDALVLAGVMVLFVMGTIASNGWDVVEMRNREVWWWTCLMALIALLMPNPYAGLLMGTIVVGLFQVGRLWYVLRMSLIPMAGIGASYALLSGHMQAWMIPWLLWTGTAIGMFLGLWTAIGLWLIPDRPFRLEVPRSWFGMWGIYEDLPRDPHLCGQANRSHTLALSVFAQACCVGLVWMGQWQALPCLPLCYLPHHANTNLEKWHHPNIGHLGQLAILWALLLLLYPQIALGLLGLALCGVAILTWQAKAAWNSHRAEQLRDHSTWGQEPWWQAFRGKPGEPWFDSGRLAYWKDVVQLIWWPAGLKAWLFGFGTYTWFAKTVYMGDKRHPHVFTTAHNEYFQQLIEHGVIGLGILLLYLGDALWRAAHGIPAQQAVFISGMTWAAIATVHFPASLIHEYHPATETKEHWFGSPSLNVWTFVLALLAEAR